MKVILTKKGEEIFVDDSDYELLNKYTWFIHKYKHTSYIGSGYKTLEDAALAYNEAAVKYHGEFAVLNKIP